MELKKKNAAELELKYSTSKDKELPKDEKGYGSFPKYDEYEIIPGKDASKK